MQPLLNQWGNFFDLIIWDQFENHKRGGEVNRTVQT